jgi:hypothetical protein
MGKGQRASPCQREGSAGAKDPAQRFQTAAEAAGVLETMASGSDLHGVLGGWYARTIIVKPEGSGSKATPSGE